MRRILLSMAILALFACSAMAASDDDGYAGLTPQRMQQAEQALDNLKSDYDGIRTYHTGPMVTRLYGVQFGFGYSAEETADQFRLNHARLFGVESGHLVPGNLMPNRQLTQPVMYNSETGQYKFTLVYYHQEVEGIPVYQAELRLLMRNDYDNPLVLAVSSLCDLGDFAPDKSYLGGYSTVAEQAARSSEPDLTDFTEQELVIWAGVNSQRENPRMAVVFEGTSDFPQEFRFVVDPQTGEILYKEDRIIFEDVVGNVSGMASQGLASENCEAEALEEMPFARVNIGGTVSYADSLGDFVIPNGGTADVTVGSEMRGEWFRVYNYVGAVENLSQVVTPPGPADFIHNAANSNVLVRAQVNAYIESNVVRSMAVAQNPSYPNLMVNEFPVTVNRTDGYCPGNAWYSPSEQSINFCQAGGSYPNTAWSAVVHHEYGHHLVNMAGSGQGQYGEGMGDCIYVVIEDSHLMGLGFFGPCTTPLRNADNSHQYPCSGAIHDCGQLLSGCVWDTRNALAQTTQGPGEYLPILQNLTINSILLHTGDQITPQITIDWLTLDDNDGNINNGTPHYWEIAAGFGLHNMDAPELAPLSFSYPLGTPDLLTPGAPTTFTVVISGIEGEAPVPGTGQLHYRIEGGSLNSVYMTEISDNNYIATLPPVDCLEEVQYYVSAEAEGIGVIYDPNPSTPRKAFAATDEVVLFEDNFDTDQGWTSSGGLWARGTPTGNGGQYGQPDPSSGHSGSTVFGYNLNGDYENNMPERHLTSPPMDCSELAKVQLNFWRWLGVEQPQYDHAYVRVSNNGSTWTTVWENTATMNAGSWVEQTFDISSVADGESTVYVRFTMGSTDVGWQWCGWNIDDVVVTGYECNPNGPSITTVILPEWTEGIPFSHVLEASGGTEPYVWTDMNSDLVGTGLNLSAGGLLSGTPVSPGVFSFTVQVV
ncbi:MAG: choice-of-anchor J domain-containing protein, partial [candidate division Zixibacteria bacterium]|nr:choice-of-anchor J domain-containing protein [candidate division Zixibacteria bacterium]